MRHWQDMLAKAELTSRQMRCLAMRCYDGATLAEIASALGIGEPRVHRHIRKALKKLAKAGLPGPRRLFARDPSILTNVELDDLAREEVRGRW